MSAELSERLLPLEGGINFRDLGGYAAADGRRVKWRRIYRSGHLAKLTPADVEHVRERGIRTIVDLRSATEQQDTPVTWHEDLGVSYWSRPHHEVFGNLHEMIERGVGTVEEARAIMIGGFRHLPQQQAEAYRELLVRIVAGETPIVFNCTAGKDRTGGGAALILAALGVPRETIAADFLLTNQASVIERLSGGRKPPPPYDRLEQGVLDAIGLAQPGYIEAFLDSVEAGSGSVEGYLRELGFTPGDLRGIREALLE
jgi:protein-tyrosine phosphatase